MGASRRGRTIAVKAARLAPVRWTGWFCSVITPQSPGKALKGSGNQDADGHQHQEQRKCKDQHSRHQGRRDHLGPLGPGWFQQPLADKPNHDRQQSGDRCRDCKLARKSDVRVHLFVSRTPQLTDRGLELVPAACRTSERPRACGTEAAGGGSVERVVRLGCCRNLGVRQIAYGRMKCGAISRSVLRSINSCGACLPGRGRTRSTVYVVAPSPVSMPVSNSQYRIWLQSAASARSIGMALPSASALCHKRYPVVQVFFSVNRTGRRLFASAFKRTPLAIV